MIYTNIANSIKGLTEAEEIKEDNLEDTYNNLYNLKTQLENIELDEDNQLTKLIKLVEDGTDTYKAFREVIPKNYISDKDLKNLINTYEDDLLYTVTHSVNTNQFNSGIDTIIANISTIYNNEEYTLDELDKLISKGEV